MGASVSPCPQRLAPPLQLEPSRGSPPPVLVLNRRERVILLLLLLAVSFRFFLRRRLLVLVLGRLALLRLRVLGPDRCRSPCYRTAFNSSDEGSNVWDDVFLPIQMSDGPCRVCLSQQALQDGQAERQSLARARLRGADDQGLTLVHFSAQRKHI